MFDFLSSLLDPFTAPLEIGTNPAAMLWLLPLTAAVCIVYKATKLREIKFVQFVRESAVLFASVMAFMAVVAIVLYAFARLVTE